MSKIGDNYRKMTVTLGKKIALLRRSRETNTPKKAKQAASARIEADHLDRVKDAMLLLADIADGKEPSLASQTIYGVPVTRLTTLEFTKGSLEDMLRTKIDCPSYYVVRDTGEFRDQSNEARCLRALLDSRKDPKAVAEKEKQSKIAELIERVRFANIPGFFPTPPDVVKRMIEAAELDFDDLTVLEPSAGIGSIADAVPKNCTVRCVEINPALQEVLRAKGHFLYELCSDFMEFWNPGEFDRVLMNPPFEHGQDSRHVRHAYDMLAPGGRLVAIMSEGPFFRQDKHATAFREWLAGTDYKFIPMDEGLFSKPDAFRKTGVKCRMVVIDK